MTQQGSMTDPDWIFRFSAVKPATAAAVPVLGAGTANAETPSWYIGHFGPDTCVPIKDIGDDFRRVYYGGGSMSTPTEVMKTLQNHGAVNNVELESGTPEGMVFYGAREPGNPKKTAFVFFQEKALCEETMSRLEK